MTWPPMRKRRVASEQLRVNGHEEKDKEYDEEAESGNDDEQILGPALQMKMMRKNTMAMAMTVTMMVTKLLAEMSKVK